MDVRERIMSLVAAAAALLAVTTNASAGLTWYTGDMSETNLNTFLLSGGGTLTTYRFEDQTVNGGDPTNFLGNGIAPDYGFTWTTQPSNCRGWAPDLPAASWGTGSIDGASGIALINANWDWNSLTPIGVNNFNHAMAGTGSLVAIDNTSGQGGDPITVTVYNAAGAVLGTHQYSLVPNADPGNSELYWGVTSDANDIAGFKFSGATWFMMDNMKTVVLSQPETAVVPEPASFALLALGGGFLGLPLVLRRRSA